MANVDVKVSTVRDASGTYLSISLGQPDEGAPLFFRAFPKLTFS